MPFNPFKSSSSSSQKDTTFPALYILYAVAAVLLKRRHPIPLADISAADMKIFLDGFQDSETSDHWTWISRRFEFEDIHDTLSSFSPESLDRRTKKSIESFVKQKQKAESERQVKIFKNQGPDSRVGYLGVMARTRKSEVESLQKIIRQRVKAPQPVKDD
ncbi:MAG: hypothetical protein LQ339_001779 [Xanthoria mediterranea]|nr:MAG: hypothetical protein LQ339_001779 [Xanthoria mediterranea]